MYAESFLLVYGTCETIKKSIARYRPYCYFDDLPSDYKSDYYKSFPSRHSAFAFMSAGFLTATFFIDHPDSPWKIPVAAGSYALAAGIAALRISSGAHFLTDVLAGAAIGSVYGWIIPMVHKKKDNENAIALNFTGNGIILSIAF
jgi:membrane-associated phospholipid phosphatase